MALWLWGCGPPYLQSQYHAQWFPSVWTQKHLAGKQFLTDADMKQIFTSWLQALVPQGDKCYVSDVDHHVPCNHEGESNLRIRVFVTLFFWNTFVDIFVVTQVNSWVVCVVKMNCTLVTWTVVTLAEVWHMWKLCVMPTNYIFNSHSDITISRC